MSSWSDLPFDILCLIAERLPYIDLFRFGAVCKTLRDCLMFGIHEYAPVLIRYWYYEQEHGLEVVDLLRMQFHRIGNMNIHQLFGCCVHASKHGWLLFSKPKQEQPSTITTFFFYNPLTNQTIQLPSLNTEGRFGSEEDVKVAATFSTIPVSNDCVIFVLFDRPCSTSEDCIISTCNLVDKRWITGNYSRPRGGHQVGSLAYANGVFHCLFYLGDSSVTFATFNVAPEVWTETYYYALSELQCCKIPSKFYLVESAGGELFFTFYGYDHIIDFDYRIDARYWHIYQFDPSQKIWTKVPTLGNRALLLYGKSSSLVMSLEAEGETRGIADKVLDFDYDWMSCSDYPSRIGNCKGMLTHPNDRGLRFREQLINVPNNISFDPSAVRF